MEIAQLSYLVLACQFRNHAQAAAHARLSASALSESLDALERKLGMVLFQRGPQGHYPTETARWLYQSVEPLLQAAEAAESLLRGEDAAPVRMLEIVSPLQFMVGPLSRALSLAARALRQDHPGIVAAARFALSRPPYVHVLDEVHDDKLSSAPWPPAQTAGRIVIDYGERKGEAGAHLLFEDGWVAIGPADRKSAERQPIGFDTLRAAPLLLPPLADAQIRQARDYCARHDLGEPVLIEEDVGTFARLAHEAMSFNLLAPRTLVATGVARLGLSSAELPHPLVSPVVARLPDGNSIAETYLALLRTVLRTGNPIIYYQPRISMRQIRYFLALRANSNMTAAARQLHVTQPALSSQLRKLEGIVGQDLFLRHKGGLEPNAHAERLASLLGPISRRCETIVATANRYAALRRQRLAIGVIPTLNHEGPLARAVAAAIEDWMRLHPTVALKIIEGPTEHLRRSVDAGEIGFALVEARVSRFLQIDLDRADRLGVVSDPVHRLLPPGDVPLSALAGMNLILPTDTFGLRQLLARAAADAGIHLHPTMEVNSLTIGLALIQRMPMATVLPQASVEALVRDGVLQFNPIADPVVPRRLSILFSPDRSLTEIERDLVSLLRQHLLSSEAAAPREGGA